MIALLILGCASPPDPPTCDGGGPALMSIGEGGRDSFASYGDGANAETTGDPLAVRVALQTSGLDTNEPMTTVVRTTAFGDTQDSIAQLTYACSDSGHGWAEVIAALPAGSSVGDDVTIVATATDTRGISASTEVVVRLN